MACVVALEYWQAVDYGYYEVQRGAGNHVAQALAALEAHPMLRALRAALVKEVNPQSSHIGHESVVRLCTRHVAGAAPICPAYAYAGCGGTAAGLIASYAMAVPLDGKPCIPVDLAGRWDVAYSFDTLKCPDPTAVEIADYIRKGVVRYCPRTHEFYANPEWAVDVTPSCEQLKALEEFLSEVRPLGDPSLQAPDANATPFEALLVAGRTLAKLCKTTKARAAHCECVLTAQAHMQAAGNASLRHAISQAPVDFPEGWSPGDSAGAPKLPAQAATALSEEVRSGLHTLVQSARSWRSYGIALMRDRTKLLDEAQAAAEKYAALETAYATVQQTLERTTTKYGQKAVEWHRLTQAMARCTCVCPPEQIYWPENFINPGTAPKVQAILNPDNAGGSHDVRGDKVSRLYKVGLASRSICARFLTTLMPRGVSLYCVAPWVLLKVIFVVTCALRIRDYVCLGRT